MDKFEKVPSGIFDKIEDNKKQFISKFVNDLEELFPETVRDGVVDFQALLDRFGKYEEEDKNVEKYNMTWIGKREAIREADEDIVGKTLKYVEEDSKNPETTQNLYIEGDNLEVIKLLRQSYYGKIKMIYIDPPYNTGNDFVYKDNFAMSEEEYAKLSGEVDEYGERLVKNSKDSGRFHSDWLNMMYPRLKVAKDLLKDDGVIFISIDDNEVHNIRKICDEIFGERNFVEQLIWKRRATAPNDRIIGKNHEYIICFAKNIESVVLNLQPRNDSINERYKNPDNDSRGRWAASDLSANGKGGRLVESCIFPIMNPDTKEMFDPPQNKCWLYNKEKIEQLLNEGRIGFRKNSGSPFLKRYITEVRQGATLPTIIEKGGFSSDSAKEIKDLFKKDVFEFSKPVSLIKIISKTGSNNEDIILDFFSGSSTTAHAILDLNAEDNGNRKYIMVQLPEPTDEKSEAYKADYKNISEIGKARIRKSGDNIKNDLKERFNKASEEERKLMKDPENLDIGFKVFKVEDTNLKRVKDTVEEGIDLEKLKAISPKDSDDFNPHFTDIDVVYEMMLKRQDIELTEEVIRLDYIGDRIYLVGQAILVCLEEKINEEMIDKIGSIKPALSWIILRDSAFDSNINLKLNAVKRLRAVIKEINDIKDQKIYWI
ncbi:site-specific DNA-methyltransferase [Tissierella creatinophila]|uniref:Putative methyltransferase n=1 Tax=Tissierella creatinophila DSM 6911 TaxID=1123403 RepID=A0A1U7M9A2_TISCR|nr:site-specific DNA-methyltransferase [Tissierella creatinophila]OLS03789.1 putative methyltransferase [Tissierella creatinophila DSM 6911]